VSSPRPARGLVAALLLAACTTPEPPSFDLDGPGEDVADRDVCAAYPGGPLSGDDLLVLVNKEPERQLAADYEPDDLVAIYPELMMPGQSGLLRRPARDAFVELARAARSESGLTLVVRSAYRSYTTQCWTFDSKVQTFGIEHAKRFSAQPGRSQHQLGTTLDITSSALGYDLTQTMGDRPEGRWLAENAHRFGFALSYPSGAEELTGYAFEPWHYRYVGKQAALELHEHGMLLEEYLQACDDAAANLDCPREEISAVIPNDGFIGGACRHDDDCIDLGISAHCLGDVDGYPGGYCTMECEATCPDRAGSNAITSCFIVDLGYLCHSRCDFELFPETGCRASYRCAPTDRPQGDQKNACIPE